MTDKEEKEKFIDAVIMKNGKQLNVIIVAQSPKIVKGLFTFNHNRFTILSRDAVQVEPPDRLYIIGTSNRRPTKDSFLFDTYSNLEDYLNRLTRTLDFINGLDISEETLLEFNQGKRARIPTKSDEDFRSRLERATASFMTLDEATRLATANISTATSTSPEIRTFSEENFDEEEENFDEDEEDFDEEPEEEEEHNL